jgi:threonine synthase
VTYISTRGEAQSLTFEDVLLNGLARDGGLYVPEVWPTLSAETIAGFAGKPFADVATEVILPFAQGAIDRATLHAMAADAYSRFDHPAVTPLVQIDRNRWVLELFHGPTLAFKDVAMQLLARLMDHALARRGQRATIVGATSGDTGGAAVEAFRGSKRVDVIVLFPDGRVSDVQRRMMTTPTDANVHAVAVKGTFDDCQALVKAMFNDHAFRDRMSLSGVNSINWARIVAQVTYYFVAAAALGAPHRAMRFAVPTGNFGDILAGWVAKRMGLPIDQLVIASNANDILPRAHASGVYEMRSVVETLSPSMDIQISSNFERFLFEASGRDAGYIRGVMGALAQGGRFELGPAAETFATEFGAVAADEALVAETILRTRAASGYLLDPHTACGVAALEAAAPQSASPGIVLATAHPAKFPDAMEKITGSRPALPPRLAALLGSPERFAVLENDPAAIKAFVERAARPATAGVQ